MKILVGMLQRGHVDRYRKEIEVAIRSTALRDAEFAYDLGDRDDVWGKEIEQCEALLILSSRGFSGGALASARRLSFVQKIGTPEGIDVEACRKRGIAVASVPDANHIAVAEHTLMFMLCMARHAWTGHAAVVRGDDPLHLKPIRTTQSKRRSNWLDIPRDFFCLLSGRTLGLIGFGDIAQEVARRARCFGMKIVYTKRTRLPPEIENRFGVAYMDMPALLGAADFVSLHATQQEGDPPIIGRKELESMRSSSIFINTARGSQVDQAALVDVLRSGRIGGACLDVYEIEPVPPGAFDGLTNVMFSPHTAGVTPWGQRFEGALGNIEAFVNKGKVAGLL